MVQTISSQKSEQIRDGEEAKDLILDIQFDAFGKRFATASSDQKIRVSSFSRTVLWTKVFGTFLEHSQIERISLCTDEGYLYIQESRES